MSDELKPASAAELMPKINECLLLRRLLDAAREAQKVQAAATQAIFDKHQKAVHQLVAMAIAGEYGERRIAISDTEFVRLYCSSTEWPSMEIVTVEKP